MKNKMITVLIALMLLVVLSGGASAWTFGPATTTNSGGSTDGGVTPSGAIWYKSMAYKSTFTVYGTGTGDTIPPWLLALAGQGS